MNTENKSYDDVITMSLLQRVIDKVFVDDPSLYVFPPSLDFYIQKVVTETEGNVYTVPGSYLENRTTYIELKISNYKLKKMSLDNFIKSLRYLFISVVRPKFEYLKTANKNESLSAKILLEIFLSATEIIEEKEVEKKNFDKYIREELLSNYPYSLSIEEATANSFVSFVLNHEYYQKQVLLLKTYLYINYKGLQ